jgi:hypothetical protein
MLNILNEKINIFETNAAMTYGGTYWSTPANLYRLGTIVYGNVTTSKSLYPAPNTVVTTTTQVEAERINYNEFLYIDQSSLAKPTNSRPVFVASASGYQVYGDAPLVTGVRCNYIKNPSQVEWAYQMVFGEALYNANESTNFELHPSEETELVIKILEFAGLVVKDLSIYGIASQMNAQTNQQEKA